MTMRYLRLLAVTTGVLLVASPSFAALTVEPTTPSVGSGIYVDMQNGAPVAAFDKSGRVLLTPGLNGPAIECNNFDSASPLTGGFLFIPPDPHCAVGPSHVINVTNVLIEWRPKIGIVDAPQVQMSLKTLFAGTGGSGVLGTETFDPRAIYDQYNGRFVVVTLERTLIAQGAAANASRILVAVSKTADPNAGWWRFSINSLLSISGVNSWADFPGLAIDDKAIYITNNMFSVTSPFPNTGVRLWIINKVPAYAGPDNNFAFTVHNPFTPAGSVATTAMPTHMWGVLPAGTAGRPLGTYLVSYSGLNAGGIEAIQFIEVTDPLGGVGGPFFALAQPSVGNIDSGAGFPGATQLGTTRRISTNDRRAQNAVWRNGQIFLAASCMPSAGADVGEVTAHWWRFICPGPAAGIALADQGNAGSEDLGADTYTFFPNVQVDSNLNMAIGFAASNAGIYGGAYYATRLFSDPAGTIDVTAPLALGVAPYVRTFSSSLTATSRWGDYSGLALDPVDESTFWIYNEYAGPVGTPTTVSGVTENGRWHTKLGNFHLQQPVSVAITSFDASVKKGVVTLSAVFRSDLGVEAVNVYRAGADGTFRTIDTVLGSRETFVYADKTASAGETYRYQIGVMDADGEFFSQEARVSLPGLVAALGQNSPNPFNPTTTIAFTLPVQETVALSVYDASGRLVRDLVNGTRNAGDHSITWDGRDNAGTTVGSGVYFYRLTAGKYSESKKMVMLK